MTRSRLLLLLPLALPCTALPAAAQVEGSYQLLRVDGRALPAPSPTEEGVTLHGGAFTFQADGRFSLRARATAATETEPRGESLAGRWAASGDSLTLTPANGGGLIGFRWMRAGDTLRIYDRGYEYTFGPAAAQIPAALPGSYRLARINGQPLPAPSPGEPSISVQEITVTLRPDGGYAMHLRAVGPGGEAVGPFDFQGRYQVDGDVLALHPDADSPAEPGEFRFTLADGALRWRDRAGDEFIFERR
jgi:hypothetical protein